MSPARPSAWAPCCSPWRLGPGSRSWRCREPGRRGLPVRQPKAWLFALAAAGTFLPAGLAPVAGGLAVAATCAVAIFPTAAVWAAGGAALRRIVDDGRTWRMINVALALALAASVAFSWI